MDFQQTSTNTITKTDVIPKTTEPTSGELLISPQQEAYISYTAVGGLMPDENSAGKKMTVDVFAETLGVDRTTLYYWRKSIPDFWDKVRARQREIGSKDRLMKAWNGIYLKTCAGNAEAGKLFFANFDPNFRMPMEKVQHELGNNFAALLMAATREGIIEGDIVNAATANADSGSGGENQPPHQNTP